MSRGVKFKTAKQKLKNILSPIYLFEDNASNSTFEVMLYILKVCSRDFIF
jgi:hypothetical protein